MAKRIPREPQNMWGGREGLARSKLNQNSIAKQSHHHHLHGGAAPIRFQPSSCCSGDEVRRKGRAALASKGHKLMHK